MTKYYVTSVQYNVLGDDLEVTLCELDGKVGWAQPHFQRSWMECEFSSELEALEALRKLYPEKLLTVLYDTGKVLTTWGHETGVTSMKIREVMNG